MMLGLGGTAIANALESSKKLPSFDEAPVVEQRLSEGANVVGGTDLSRVREEVYMELGPGAVPALQRKLPSGTISFAEDWTERKGR